MISILRLESDLKRVAFFRHSESNCLVLFFNRKHNLKTFPKLDSNLDIINVSACSLRFEPPLEGAKPRTSQLWKKCHPREEVLVTTLLAKTTFNLVDFTREVSKNLINFFFVRPTEAIVLYYVITVMHSILFLFSNYKRFITVCFATFPKEADFLHGTTSDVSDTRNLGFGSSME